MTKTKTKTWTRLASLSCRQQRSQRRPALGSITWQVGLQAPCLIPLGPLGQVQQPRCLARRDNAQRNQLGEGLRSYREIVRLLQPAKADRAAWIEPLAHLARQEARHQRGDRRHRAAIDDALLRLPGAAIARFSEP